jgi:carbon monoxide dehydrogenase subunit G
MQIKVSKDINAPIERVFDVFSDITQAEQRVAGISKVEILSDVKQGKGTHWRETRVMFGREATEEMEISAFNPNQSYEVVAESRGMKYHTIYTFTSNGDITRVEMVFSGKPMTLVAKLMSPLGMLMQGPARKALDADMDDLKRVAERSSTTR